MSKDLKHFEARFGEIADFITFAADKVRADHTVEMGDLEAKVTALCGEVKAAGGTVARDIQPMMSDMIAGLDDLATALEGFSEKHKKRIK